MIGIGEIRSFLKENRFFAGLAILEALFALALLIRLFLPSQIITVRGSELIRTGSLATVTEGESQSVSTQEGEAVESEQLWETPELTLRPGAWHVEVLYESARYSEEEQEAGSSGSAGWCFLSSEGNGAAFSECSLILDDGINVRRDMIWVKTGSLVSDAKMVFYYNGEGSLRIDRVVFTESGLYKLTRLLAALCLFAAVDILYMAFWGTGTGISPEKKKRWAFLLAVIALSSLPLLVDGVADGHDLSYHMERILALSEELRGGQFPVRLQRSLLDGYGYGGSLLYGDILLYFPAFLHLLYVPLHTAYKIYVLAANAATCLISYYCFRKISGSDFAGLIGSAAYSLSVTRIVNVHLRAAVGEYSAMIFLPLILLGMWNLLTAEKDEKITLRQYLPLSIGFVGVLQTHVISCDMAAIFVVLSMLAAWKKAFRGKVIWAILKAALLAVGLSAWFLLPFIEYMGEDLKVMTRTQDLLQRSGTYLAQVLNPFAPAVGDNIFDGMTQEMPMALGLMPVAGLVLYFWRRSFAGADRTKEGRTAAVLCGLGAAAILFSTIYFPWDSIKMLLGNWGRYVSVIQFPWRYLTIASLLLSAALAEVLQLWEREGKHRLVRRIGLGLCGAAASILCLFYMNMLNDLETVRYYNSADIGYNDVSVGEYLPSKAYVDDLQEEEPQSDGAVTLSDYQSEGVIHRVSASNAGEEAAWIEFPLLYYKDYQAADENTGEGLKVEESDRGRVRVEIPAGYEGQIVVQFAPPARWRAAELVSLCTFAGLILLVWKRGRKSKTAISRTG